MFESKIAWIEKLLEITEYSLSGPECCKLFIRHYLRHGIMKPWNFTAQVKLIFYTHHHQHSFCFHGIVTEFNSSQFVTTQSIYESTKRRNWQVILVDAESWCQTWQIRTQTSGIHGNVKVWEKTWASQETCRANAKRRNSKWECAQISLAVF